MDKLKVFISYANQQKQFAGDLKSWFEGLIGAETFVAHDDIEGGTEWQNDILEQIQTTDLFICILSEDYRSSEYCDQELGIAIALHKKILPIKYDLNPYGFIRHIQAFVPHKTDVLQIENLFYRIMGTLLKTPVESDIKNKLLNTLFMKLAISTTYDLSYKLISFILDARHELNNNHYKLFSVAYKNNRNVSMAYNADSLMNILKSTD